MGPAFQYTASTHPRTTVSQAHSIPLKQRILNARQCAIEEPIVRASAAKICECASGPADQELVAVFTLPIPHDIVP